MPSANVGPTETFYQGQFVEATRRGNPVEDVRKQFRNNMNKTTRIAKQKLAAAVRDKLSEGVSGEGYHPEYAARKNRDPRAEGGPYSSAGPVDFRYSGRLWDEIVGRGRARPSKDEVRIWAGLRNRNKSRSASAPGSFSTFGQLVDHLKRSKSGSRGNPFSIEKKERDRIAEETARELFSNN